MMVMLGEESGNPSSNVSMAYHSLVQVHNAVFILILQNVALGSLWFSVAPVASGPSYPARNQKVYNNPVAPRGFRLIALTVHRA